MLIGCSLGLDAVTVPVWRLDRVRLLVGVFDVCVRDERLDVEPLLLGKCFEQDSLFGEITFDVVDLFARGRDLLAEGLDLAAKLIHFLVEVLRDAGDFLEFLGRVAESHVPALCLVGCAPFGQGNVGVKDRRRPRGGMDRLRLAPAIGVLACLAFLAALVVPFQSPGAGTYYASGALNPLIAGLFAVVTLIVFAAGRQDRTDPLTAAGIALAFGLVIVLTAFVWATTARTDVLAITSYHRHVLVGTGAIIPLVAAWYARELGVW